MRKLIMQMQTTVNGYVADASGRNDWQVWNWGADWNWDAGLRNYFNTVIGSVDCILLSRKMAMEGFITHWTNAAKDINDPRFAYATKVNQTHKVVFTKTLEHSVWPNVDLANGDLTEEVNRLKSQKGNNIIVYGGVTFASALIKAGLVDEYQFFVNPVAIENGQEIFKAIGSRVNLTLVNAVPYDCGIVVLSYRPKK